MKLYNDNIISFPKTGTKFLSKKLTSTDDLTYEDLFTNEKYKDKFFYIIIRNPKDNLISAINVSLGYEYNPTLKQTMEDILLNKEDKLFYSIISDNLIFHNPEKYVEVINKCSK